MKRLIPLLLAVILILPACTTQKGGKNMANMLYLYNGVALPKIPDAPSANSMATFTKATIVRNPAVDGYWVYWSGSTYRIDMYTKSDGTEELYAYNRPYNFWSYYWSYDAAKNAWVYGGGGAYASSKPSACFPAADVIWTNYDLKYVDDTTVYLASSEPVATTVTGITLNQTEVSLNRGETFRFSASVSGTGAYDTSVTYTLSGNSPNGGTTLSADGLLTVGESETSPTVTVTATSVQNSAVFQNAAVTVADFLSKLTMDVPQGGVVFDGEITTVEADGLCVAELEALSDFYAGDQLLVEFNGATFTVVAQELYGDYVLFGELNENDEPVFTEMPVCVMSLNGWLLVATETPGTYSLKIEKTGGVTDTTATVNFSCKDLLHTDSVYRIKAWLYEPSGYSYNGVELPDINEVWVDREAYPYAHLTQKNGAPQSLLISKFKLYYVSPMLNTAEVGAYREYNLVDGAWVLKNDSRYQTANIGLFRVADGFLYPFWVSYDIPIGKDGTDVWLAASDPVPSGLDTTLPPTWTSDLFAGPTHSESHTFTGLTPNTEYAVYGVITANDVATEHNATATFRTLDGEGGADYSNAFLEVSYEEVTTNSAYLEVDFSGIPQGEELFTYLDCTLDDGTEARENPILVDNPPSDNVDGVLEVYFDDLEPGKEYTATFRLKYQMFGESGYTDTGKGISYTFTTLADTDPNSFPMGFASGLSGMPVTKANADHNKWMQGYIVGDAFRKMM